MASYTTSETSTYQPSNLEWYKGLGAKSIGDLLMPMILSGLSGQPSSQQLQQNQFQQQAIRKQAGGLGIELGDPRMMELFKSMSENLTKPNPDIMDMAFKLYSGTTMPGTTTTTGKTKPSYDFLDYMMAMASMGGAGANIYGAIKKPSSGGTTGMGG